MCIRFDADIKVKKYCSEGFQPGLLQRGLKNRRIIKTINWTIWVSVYSLFFWNEHYWSSIFVSVDSRWRNSKTKALITKFRLFVLSCGRGVSSMNCVCLGTELRVNQWTITSIPKYHNDTKCNEITEIRDNSLHFLVNLTQSGITNYLKWSKTLNLVKRSWNQAIEFAMWHGDNHHKLVSW